MTKIDDLLNRGVANIIPSRDYLKKQLKSKLNIYFGIDPTATRLHLGNAVPLKKLQQFAELGHNITFLIGDFTALIGDTSDKDQERPVLSSSQIKENFKNYKKQAEKILDFSEIKIRYNSEWLSNLTFTDIVKLTQRFSVGDFISRELIKKRLISGSRVGLHEVLYPVMQGYDSYFLNTDLQIGGTDQTFNMQAGRTLQKVLRNKETSILSTPFLIGTDGRKMSKSWGNTIWLDDDPKDAYIKVMALPDNHIIEYFTLVTDLEMDKIKQIAEDLKNGKNPISYKKMLAFEIVKQLNSHEDAHKAQEEFEKTIQNNQLPEKIAYHRTQKKDMTLEDILVTTKLAESKSDSKRKIEQGGVTIDGEKITDPNKTIVFKDGMIISAGKRFVRINWEP